MPAESYLALNQHEFGRKPLERDPQQRGLACMVCQRHMMVQPGLAMQRFHTLLTEQANEQSEEVLDFVLPSRTSCVDSVGASANLAQIDRERMKSLAVEGPLYPSQKEAVALRRFRHDAQRQVQHVQADWQAKALAELLEKGQPPRIDFEAEEVAIELKLGQGSLRLEDVPGMFSKDNGVESVLREGFNSRVIAPRVASSPGSRVAERGGSQRPTRRT